MEIQYKDRIHRKKITVKVNAKVAHFIAKENEKKKTLLPEEVAALSSKKQEEYNQRQFEKKQESLDALLEDGFQPTIEVDIIQEIETREREKRYLNSVGYKIFRKNLKDEIRKTLDIMPTEIQKVMFLRFFKDMSISQIAKELGITKSTAQTQISRGCGYIKYFLNKDIKEQDKREQEYRMKRAQQRLQNRGPMKK